jgi:hypothetical protein
MKAHPTLPNHRIIPEQEKVALPANTHAQLFYARNFKHNICPPEIETPVCPPENETQDINDYFEDAKFVVHISPEV